MMSSISGERKSKKAKVVKASAPKSKTTGRSSGHPNYQTDKLLDIIEAVKPLGSENWKAVARQYKIISGEELERDYNDLKIKFKKLHNLGAGKPTGTPTMVASQTRARRIFKDILQKEGCSTTCNDSDNDAESKEEDGEHIEDDFAGEEEEYSHSELNNSFDSTRDNDEEDELNLDDQINMVEETELQDSSMSRPPVKVRKASSSPVVSNNSTAVKTKNSRPSKQTGRGTVELKKGT